MGDLMGKQSLIKGTLILAISGFIIKLIGFFFKVILARIIGDEGFGIYNVAYSIYSPVLILFVSGIPVAISQLSARENGINGMNNSNIFATMLLFNSIFGLILALIFVLLAQIIAVGLVKDTQVLPALVGIGPAIFFGALLAVFRGYFQGMQKMLPTALSQLIEQIIRVGAALFLIHLLMEYGNSIKILGVTAAAGIGGFAGLLVLLLFYLSAKKSGEIPVLNRGWFQINIIAKVMKLAIPITLGALAIALMQFLDGTIVPRRLIAIGYSQPEARALFGGFGMANSLVSFPISIAVAISVNLLPLIARDCVKSPKLTQYRIGQAIRWSGIIGFPASLGLFLLAYPATKLIFNTEHAFLPLQVLSWSVILISLNTVVTGIIQGFGKTYLPAKNLVLGGVVNGLINYTLTPLLGIRGAALGTIFGYLISLRGNLRDLKQLTGFKNTWNILFPSFAASITMGGIVYLSLYMFQRFEFNQFQLVSITVMVGIISYIFLLLLFKGITFSEIKSLFQLK